MHAAEQDAALAEDIGAVLHLQRGGKRERRADGDGPAERDVGGVPGGILVHGEGRVDARAANLLALLVEPADGGAHALGRDEHDVDILAEGLAVRLHDAEQKAVRQAKRRAGLHGGEDAGVHLACAASEMSSITRSDLAMIVEGLAERAVLLGEAARARLLVGLRGGAEADAHLGVHARLLQRVAEVLALRGRLGAPPDDADGVDALERPGSFSKRWRPPRTMYSPSPATSTSSFSKILVLMSSSGCVVAALAATTRRASATGFFAA